MNVRSVLCGILMVGAIGMAAPAGAGNDRLTLRVTPAVCFAPANLMVRATILADAANRAVTIVAESPEFYRSSEIQLDGDRAPRTSVVEFRSLPRGWYEVTATLTGANGRSVATVHQQVNVIASTGGD